jgi:hypothetical protein
MSSAGIKGLRILPPIVIARFGSSPSPMDNYDVNLPLGADGKPTSGYRKLVPPPPSSSTRATAR